MDHSDDIEIIYEECKRECLEKISEDPFSTLLVVAKLAKNEYLGKDEKRELRKEFELYATSCSAFALLYNYSTTITAEYDKTLPDSGSYIFDIDKYNNLLVLAAEENGFIIYFLKNINQELCDIAMRNNNFVFDCKQNIELPYNLLYTRDKLEKFHSRDLKQNIGIGDDFRLNFVHDPELKKYCRAKYFDRRTTFTKSAATCQ